jgi:N-acetylglucosaminyldiphosphoundecaprenol N-acetyl-beta-D-mannosaminyltransferase
MNFKIKHIFITGLKFHNIIKQEFKFLINDLSKNSNKKIYIVTPNVDFVVRADYDNEFKKIINSADISVCDSTIIYQCSKLLNQDSLRDKITGFDAMTVMLENANKKEEKIFLLGSTDDTIKLAAENISKIYPDLKVAGFINGFFNVEKDTANIIKSINNTGAKYLFIGMGSPRQEKWVYKNKNVLNTNFIISVGGLFDIYSEKIKRAPVIFQQIGMEWFWRFLNDPRRLFRRYFIEDMKFFYLLFKQILKKDNKL